jgi:hypothetical protein
MGVFSIFETYYKWVILWKTNTPESKIYTSPFQNIMKFGMHIGPIARYLSLPIFFLNSVKRVLIFGINNHSHWGKGSTYARFLFNNSFGNAFRENIKEFIIKPMKFSF